MECDEIMEWLHDYGLNIKTVNDNNFTIASAREVYCPGHQFVPSKMLEKLKSGYTETIEKGYKGLRVTGEMSWAIKGIPGSEKIIEYESLVNTIYPDYPVTAVCQYNVNDFSGAMIMNVLKVHPKMIAKGRILENPYYIKPEIFFRG